MIRRTYQVGFDSLFSSLLVNLDIAAVASQLQKNGCITSEECQQISEWTRSVPKQEALHAFLHILSKSPLRSLKTALSQCANSPGHKDLLKQIKAMGVLDTGGSGEEQINGHEADLSEYQVHE